MDNEFNEIALLVICASFSLFMADIDFAITGFLAGIILICVRMLAPQVMRMTVLMLFSICAIFSSDIACYLPLAAYLAMHESLWTTRLVWLITPLVWIGYYQVTGTISIQSLSYGAMGAITILCFAATLLAIQSIRSSSELNGFRFAYDNLREKYLAHMQQTIREVDPHSNHLPSCESEECFEGLTERELAIVRLVAEGMDNRQIAKSLFLSEGTVRNHISSILNKKELTNRTQIAVLYYRGE